MADSGFRHEVYQPALGSYDAAVSTGAIGLLKSPRFNELVVEFEQFVDDFRRHDELGGEMMYLGSYWNLRRKLGSLHAFAGSENFQPRVFSLNDAEFRGLFADPEVYAAFENMQWIYRNEWEILSKARGTAQRILDTLDSL